MPSVTSWTRLEPVARSSDLAPGLQARVHDPLWLLARQWQLGEFTGEDAGSPALVRLRAQVAPVSTYRPHDGTIQKYDRKRPLEAVVEADRVPDLTDLRLSARTGRHFLRLLGDRPALAAYRGAFAEAYPLTGPASLDERSRRWLSVMRRGASGAALLPVLQAFADSGTLPSRPAVPAADVPALRQCARDWLDWLAEHGITTTGTPVPAAGAPSWQPARMEYRFEVSAPAAGGGQTVMSAVEYDGSTLDWYSFAHDTDATLPATGQVETRTRTVLPAPATYPGMPAPRWWEFEDARVDFGRVEAEPTDLGRLLLVEYATVYGNDWYVVPLTVPVASVVTIRSLVVTDTFGFRTLVRAAGARPGDGQDWSMFRHTATGSAATGLRGRSDHLLIAPAIADRLESEPVEEVRMFRDEMANIAWAVEATVEGTIGHPVRRQEAGEAATSSTLGDAGDLPHYRLTTTVPEHWFPLLPQEPTRGAYRLRRGGVPRRRDGQTVVPAPLGQLLQPDQDLLIHEEEVPREGLHVSRMWQRARWSDGSTHVWIGRRKQPGRGEGSSELVFDVITDRP